MVATSPFFLQLSFAGIYNKMYNTKKSRNLRPFDLIQVHVMVVYTNYLRMKVIKNNIKRGGSSIFYKRLLMRS
jgi:hypothetical protein